MTEPTGQPPEERLPAPRPPAVPSAPADRFTAAPSAHRAGLTPERSAKIVRQSANARFAGFLAVVVVGLFVIGYYFYELGLPGGLSTARLIEEREQQQVVAIERGYNIYQANCASCHGAKGEGGSGPTLNRQDKLFAHLDEAYLRNILEVGGRYACGNPNSIMPIWSNTGNPPGPLNYRQIDELIAFLRAEKGHEYEIRDPELNEPILGPNGEPLTFEGWVDPSYRPEPGATPYPACWSDEFNTPATPAPTNGGGTPAPSGPPPGPPSGVVLRESALNIQFEARDLRAPADQEFQIEFENKDAGVPHNIEIKDASGATVFKGEIFNGVETRTYTVPPLAAGSYSYICTVHPNMTGTLTVGG